MASGEHKRRIFKNASKTYFNSSLFFPPQVRNEVFTLYAFVRTADDFVDAVPQDAQGFYAFRRAYDGAVSGQQSGNPIIDDFVALAYRRGFEPEWTEAFLDSMEWDLSVSCYQTLDATLRYIYGSAEVIGSFMARLLGLPKAAEYHARMQGRAMQYINFVRDIAEDNEFGRVYLPLSETSLKDLTHASATRNPEEYTSFVRRQIARYLQWQQEAEEGYRFIPRRFLIPIRTASDMYNWTAQRIASDPFVVFRRKVKPRRARVFAGVARNFLRPRGGPFWSSLQIGNRSSPTI
jgi:phytoene synthase